MGLKEFIHRLFAKGYMPLDKKGVTGLLSNIDFFREKGYALSFLFLNSYNHTQEIGRRNK